MVIRDSTLESLTPSVNAPLVWALSCLVGLLALPPSKRLCIGVRFGYKILAQTWPNVWVISGVSCIHTMNEHVP